MARFDLTDFEWSVIAPLLPNKVRGVDPLSVACDNGTILLRKTIQTRPSERKDYITRRLGVPYIEGGGCPRFHAFLERVMPDADMREFLQRIAGCCLTGSTREQCVFIFYGIGRNGKSTFVNVLRYIMGDHAMNSSISTFLAKREGSGGSEAWRLRWPV
jgi:putative DNA primase/helicase